MNTSQVSISREIRRFMAETSKTQADIAQMIGVSQPQVSARLHGRARWSLDDVDALRAAGVPVGLALTHPATDGGCA